MTFQPAPPPLPIGRSTGAAQPVWRSLLCWLTIVACVATLMGVTVVRKSAPKADNAPTMQQVFAARYAAGARTLLDSASSVATTSSTSRQLVRQMTESAKSDRDRLYAAVLAADMDSTEAGRAPLVALAENASAEPIRSDAVRFLSLFTSGAEPLTDEERAGLVARHDWVARYALTRASPADSPDRREIDGAARRTFIAAISFGMIVLIALVEGLVLFVLACIFLSTGVLRMASGSPAARDVALLEAFTLYLLLMTLSMTWSALDLPGGRIAALPLALAGFGLGMVWPFWHRAPQHTVLEVRSALGLHAGRGVMTELFFGMVGYIALLPLMLVGILVTVLLTRLSGADASHPLGEQMTGPLVQFLLLVLMATVFAPVTEELLFRGALFGHLRARIAWPVAGAITALIFGAIHPQGWAGIPVVTMIGFNMAVIRQWRGSIIAPIAAHALNNGSIVLLMGLAMR